MLTSEQVEELGGVEFKALNALLWIVPGVRLFSSFHDTLLKSRVIVSYYGPVTFICRDRSIRVDGQVVQ